MGNYIINRSTPAIMLDAKNKADVVGTQISSSLDRVVQSSTSCRLYKPTSSPEVKTLIWGRPGGSQGFLLAENTQFAFAYSYPMSVEPDKEQNEIWHVTMTCMWDQSFGQSVIVGLPFYGRINTPTFSNALSYFDVDAGSSGTGGVRINQYLPITAGGDYATWYDQSSEAAGVAGIKFLTSTCQYITINNDLRDAAGQDDLHVFGVIFECRDPLNEASGSNYLNMVRMSVSAYRYGYNSDLVPFYEPQT